jgi:transposase-like protein
MRERKIYPKEFKEGTVDIVVGGGRTAQSATRELGVCAGNVRRWVQRNEKWQRLKAKSRKTLEKYEDLRK